VDFNASRLQEGDLEHSYVCVIFFPPVNCVSWRQAAFEWNSVCALVEFSL